MHEAGTNMLLINKGQAKREPFKGIGGGGSAKKNRFCSFWYMLKPHLSSFQDGVICISIIETFSFTGTFVRAVFQNIGKIALCRKNGHF